MPTFSYKARDNQGGLVTGTLDGNDKAAVEERLDRMSLIPITISAAKEKTQLSFAKLNTFFEKISDPGHHHLQQTAGDPLWGWHTPHKGPLHTGEADDEPKVY